MNKKANLTTPQIPLLDGKTRPNEFKKKENASITKILDEQKIKEVAPSTWVLEE